MVQLSSNTSGEVSASSQLVAGEIFTGIISSVNIKDESFYIVLNNESLQLPEECSELFWTPMVSEKFLLNSEEGFMRCIRVPLDDTNLDRKVFMKIFFIDTGESLIMEILAQQDNMFFEMPNSLQEIPGLAMKCKWSLIEVDHTFSSDLDFIKENLYCKLTFEVVQVLENHFLVNVLPYDNASESLEVLTFPENNEESEIKFELPQKTENKIFTAEDIAVLYEEPLNTGNPLLAADGFVTRDDTRLCKFYDPEIGGCFKGGRCKQRHHLEIKDGTCRDTLDSPYMGIVKILPVPALHSWIRIEITHFYSINKFICRYLKLKPIKSESKIDLMSAMNDEENVKKYRKIREMPGIKQLVLYEASDGTFYRARVESDCDKDFNVELLLVDLGVIELAGKEKIYYWCKDFDVVSFQAVEMEIVNIKPLPGNAGDEEGIKIIKDYMKMSENSGLKALVYGNIGDIKVKLYNKNEDDIGQELIDRNLALEKTIDSPNMIKIPG